MVETVRNTDEPHPWSVVWVSWVEGIQCRANVLGPCSLLHVGNLVDDAAFPGSALHTLRLIQSDQRDRATVGKEDDQLGLTGRLRHQGAEAEELKVFPVDPLDLFPCRGSNEVLTRDLQGFLNDVTLGLLGLP